MDLALVVHHADAAGDGEAVLRTPPSLPTGQRLWGQIARRRSTPNAPCATRPACPRPREWRSSGLCVRRYTLVGRLTDAVELGREAVDAYCQIGDRLREGDSLSALVLPLWVLGRLDEAEAAATDAVAVLEGCEEGRELARAYAALALPAFDRCGPGRRDPVGKPSRDPGRAARRRANARLGPDEHRGVRFAHGDEAARIELERILALARAGSMAIEVGTAFSWLACRRHPPSPLRARIGVRRSPGSTTASDTTSKFRGPT